MKKTLIASALIAMSVAASGSAFAQRGDHGNERNDGNAWGQQQNNDRHDGDRNDDNGRHEGGRHDGDRNDDNGRHEGGRHDGDRNDNGRHVGDRHDGDRYEGDRHDGDRREYAQQYRGGDDRGGDRHHDWRRGERLSQEYRDNRYVVTDWRARRLSAPPRGHHWVRAGNDYVLVAVATGVIAQVLLNN